MDDDDKYWPDWKNSSKESRQLSYIPSKPLERERAAFVEAVKGHHDPKQYELELPERGVPQ